MNYLDFFGSRRSEPIFVNTVIGDLADVHPTASSLASALGLAASEVQLFEIDSFNNIRCSININYDGAGLLNTFYYDFKGNRNFIKGGNTGVVAKIIDYSNALFTEQAFRLNPLEYVILPNVIGEAQNAESVFAQISTLRLIYLPSWFNSDISGKNYFGWLDINNCVGYFHKNLETVNNGSLHPSIQKFLDRSPTNEARFIQNKDKPNPVTDLSVSNVTSNSTQLNFTAPAINTNSNDFYYVYIDYTGISFEFKYSERQEISALYDKITGSGDTITGLPANTDIKVQIQTVDFYHNVSTYSNPVFFKTAQ